MGGLSWSANQRTDQIMAIEGEKREVCVCENVILDYVFVNFPSTFTRST